MNENNLRPIFPVSAFTGALSPDQHPVREWIGFCARNSNFQCRQSCRSPSPAEKFGPTEVICLCGFATTTSQPRFRGQPSGHTVKGRNTQNEKNHG